MYVSATGTPVASLKARRAAAARPRTAPLPANATTLAPPVMNSTARASDRSDGSVCAGSERGSGRASSGGTAAAITSSGSSRWVAPGFSCSATSNALRTVSGTMPGPVTRAFHLVIGRISETTSTYWWLSFASAPARPGR